MVKPKKTLEEIRAAASARAKKYQQSQRDQGKRHLTALISQEVFDIIAWQRERTGATVVQVVESAIKIAYGEPGPLDLPQAPEPIPEPELDRGAVEPLSPEPAVDRGEDEPGIPDCHGKDLSQAEKDSILIKVVDLYPGRGNAQKRADVLNRAGVPCGRGKTPWDAKKVMDTYRHAKKRQDQ